MGYHVQIENSTAAIPAGNLNEAYKRMCALNFTTPNSAKNGGAFGGGRGIDIPATGPHPDRWFSWMPWNYHKECKDAQDILERLGFWTSFDEDGSLLIDGYDSKTGQEKLFLEAIVDLMKGEIEWRGEGGELYKWELGGSKLKRRCGTVVYR